MSIAATFLVFILALMLGIVLAFFILGYRKNKSNASQAEGLAMQQSFNNLQTKLQKNLLDLQNDLQKTLFEATANQARESREELQKNVLQLGKLNANQLKTISETSHKEMGEMRAVLDRSLKNLQDSNDKKLTEMRATVDEKLKDVLEKRLTASFESVGRMLGELQEKFGEMKSLSTNFEDLKKVFTNVKTRGGLGELQLENIITDVLGPEQYVKNLKVREKSKEAVEFAIKIPSENEYSLLPIDAKFPTSAYEEIQSAREKSDAGAIERAQKKFVTVINGEAKKIGEKYIYPPKTTDYAVLFLPSEALYAEAAQLALTAGVESTWNKYRVMIAGPSTLTAIFSSFRFAFNMMALTRHQGEAFRLLGFLQTAFVDLADSLEKSEKQIDSASSSLKKARKQTAKIGEQLRQVDSLGRTENFQKTGVDENKKENISIAAEAEKKLSFTENESPLFEKSSS